MVKIFIVAEAGVNHNNSLNYAYKLIDVAKNAGADAVKFQVFKTGNYIAKNTPLAIYQRKNIKKISNQYDLIKNLELSEIKLLKIKSYAKKKKIKFFLSPFDKWGIEFIKRNNIDLVKIPSGEINNFPYLKQVGLLKKKIILSTGMSNLSEIEDALRILTKYGTKKNNITLLHCTTEYPTPMSEVNLKAILSMKKKFKTKVGLSDHSLGSEVAIAAVAMGAEVIEKHITLNKKMRGPDHKASMEPKDFSYLVRSVRNIEKAIGNGLKKPSKSEKKNILTVRKYIVASQGIKRGAKFTNYNITVKRCSNKGLEPYFIQKILGKVSKKNFEKDEVIKL
tara:strand:- start:234 stop:1241 length:1008 start_codon:yes stop_codon:yes gene_type:complete